MIIGYGNEVIAAGQTGNLGVAKLLVEEWDRWVCGPEAVLDEAEATLRQSQPIASIDALTRLNAPC